MSKKKSLTLTLLKSEAKRYLSRHNDRPIKELFGVNDGKAIGTYVEHDFQNYLNKSYSYQLGNSASGIDFPILKLDIKVTSIRQPQSSCPYRDATQKVYGLGYDLLIFVYEKTDNHKKKHAKMNFLYAIFVESSCTADFQTTKGINGILDRNGNKDDLIAFLEERNLPLDDIGRESLAKRILSEKPKIGYLTISNALQWRLQYTRVIELAGTGGTNGVENILK